MNSLYSIIQVLRPSEVKLIKHYYERPVNAEDKLRLALLKIVQDQKGLSNGEAIELLKAGMSNSAFSHLKRRLKEDMLNALLWQESSKRFGEGFTAAEFECSKNLAQAYILMVRGNDREGRKLLERSKKLALRFELFSHKLMIDQLTRRRVYGLKGKKQLDSLNKEILEDLDQIALLDKAEKQTLLLAAPQLFSKEEIANFKKDASSMVSQLKSSYTQSKLGRIGFWYLMAATEHHRSISDHEGMLSHGIEFFDLVNKSDALRSDPNISGVSQTVGVALLNLHRFKEAEEYLSISGEKFRDGGMNQLNSLELLLKAQLAAYGTYRGKETVNKAMQHKLVLQRERLLARWNYFKACREFLSSNAEESYSTINSNGDLLKWRDDFNVQYRILEVLQLIELEDHDWIDFKLDTLRKFVARNRKLKTPRIDAIIKVLNAIHSKSYRFDKLNQSTLKLIEGLNSNAKGWAWKPVGNELVRFDSWLERRMG